MVQCASPGMERCARQKTAIRPP
ncbi:MAG: hypothetical protein QOD87_518, partial [Pseudonocardiales bacterium]|nr:hypothetical protein [Pseudonocardiales bacterium]